MALIFNINQDIIQVNNYKNVDFLAMILFM